MCRHCRSSSRGVRVGADVAVVVGGGTQQPVSPGRQIWKQEIPPAVVVVRLEVVVGGGMQQPVSPGRQKWSQTMVAAPTWLARRREARMPEKEDATESFIV